MPSGTTTYNYINGFPNDGFYTVANGSFGNPFGWHEVLDHTPGDANGKFLMVNADFSAGEFYRTLISGLCETTTYEFSAWILNLAESGGFCSTQPGGTIPINVRFEIWDSSDTTLLASGSTGNIFDTFSPNWQQFALVFQTLVGQNEVILKMINNGQGGCGNDLAIDDLEFKTCGDTITNADSNNNQNVDLCLENTSFSTTLTVTPDFSVFANHFYQWQESTDGNTWTDIPGETLDTYEVVNLTQTRYYRAKVAESAGNLGNEDCITYSDVYIAIINVAPNEPDIECWQTATLNNATCSWEITGTQPEEPSDLACWQTTVFNETTCDWDIIGTQPNEPDIECWEIASFNDINCAWEISGDQPDQPTDLECWETAIFNDTACDWEVIGTQPEEPIDLECWQSASFNNTTCSWDITGTQPEQPNLECWQTATFNSTTCAWEISGTQPEEPTDLTCWESTSFNNTTCSWEITGSQPEQPTDLECWQSTIFNESSCDWDIVGDQPEEPTDLKCWETAIFDNSLCLWGVTGTQPQEPTDLECWQEANFNNDTCLWEVSGTEPIDTLNETVIYCEGEEAILNANIGIANPNYDWSTGESSEEITVSTPGIYSVEITEGDLCFTTVINFEVIQAEIPVIESVVSVGTDIVVTISSFGDYEYSLDGITYQQSNIFTNVPGGYYTIYVRNINDCDVTTISHLHFIIPLFFTPNNDGFNDTFELVGIETFESSEVFIFDRYGKLLKSGKNQPFKWDGTFNNKKLHNSDYWYLVTIEGQSFRGHFTLKR